MDEGSLAHLMDMGFARTQARLPGREGGRGSAGASLLSGFEGDEFHCVPVPPGRPALHCSKMAACVAARMSVMGSNRLHLDAALLIKLCPTILAVACRQSRRCALSTTRCRRPRPGSSAWAQSQQRRTHQQRTLLLLPPLIPLHLLPH